MPIKYPRGVRWPKKAGISHSKSNSSKLQQSPENKYRAKKIELDGYKFDSKAEAAYYYQLKTLKQEFKVHERFQICPSFKLHGKTYRSRSYTPDFSIYDGDELLSVIDVKGGKATLTTDSKLRMVLFMHEHEVPVVIARYDYKNKVFKEELL